MVDYATKFLLREQPSARILLFRNAFMLEANSQRKHKAFQVLFNHLRIITRMITLIVWRQPKGIHKQYT